jgi:hypothetical protein
MSDSIMTKAYRSYQTAFHVPVQDILPMIGSVKRVFIHTLGSWVDLQAPRLIPFTESLKCYACGRKGAFFAVQRHLQPHGGRKWHLNLYSEDGRLMTCDHVIPKSSWTKEQRHLADDPNNLRTMCDKCNTKKGSRPIEQFMQDRTFHH